MPRRANKAAEATVEEPQEQQKPAAQMASCIDCGADVPLAEIASHVCATDTPATADPAPEPGAEADIFAGISASEPADDGPRPVYATCPITTWAPWVVPAIDDVAGDGTETHAVVVFSDDKPPVIASVSGSQEEAVNQAGSIAERGILQGELRVYTIAAIRAAAGIATEPSTAAVDVLNMPDAPEGLREAAADALTDAAPAHAAVGEALKDAVASHVTDTGELPTLDDQEPNPETGQLFNVQRPKIERDLRDPDLLVLNFSGSVPLERGSEKQVEFFNDLQTGEELELRFTVRVGSETLRARLNREGDEVKDRVLARGITITDVHFEQL